MYCAYYHAYVPRKTSWFLVATLKSVEHIAFDRTLEKTNGLFEFFVAPGFVSQFEQLMAYYDTNGIVTSWHKLPNRIEQLHASV
jgi:hypothetical protein